MNINNSNSNSNNSINNNNSNNSNTYQNSDSVILNLESLSKKYKNLLVEYKQAVLDYVNFLKQETSNPCGIYSNSDVSGSDVSGSDVSGNDVSGNKCNIQFGSIQNALYNGTMDLGQGEAASLQECQASCENTSGCTGAIYNKGNNNDSMCLLRGGNGNVSSADENSYAIIPKEKQLLLIIQNINKQLTDINQEIQTISSNNAQLANSQTNSRIGKSKELMNQFQQLIKEKTKINNMVSEFDKLDQVQDEGLVVITKNYYSFVLLLLLAILFIFILYKTSFTSSVAEQTSVMMGGGSKLW
jgi:hypothetical protein